MDIDQLTPEQIELSFKLCDILSLEDLTVAATVLSGYNWNIEVFLWLSQKAVNELQVGSVQQSHLSTPPLKKPNYPIEES